MIHIFQREINTFLNSFAAYLVIIVFLVVTGLFAWVFPQTSILTHGYAELDALFTIAPYVFMFLIPAVTMRSFAEEKRSGTMELLHTLPVTNWQLILGKYFASLSLVLLSLVPTSLYYYSVYNLGSPPGNLDSAAVLGAYIGLSMLAAVFCAIGLLASSLTESQIIAFILAVFFCYLLYDGFTSLSRTDLFTDSAYLISQFGIDFHYRAISKGLIDSRNLLYFFSLAVFMLFFTHRILSSRKW